MRRGLLAPFAFLWELQPKEKILHPPSASVGSFCFYPSHEQAQLGLKTKIPGPVRRDQGFFFVDKRFEISNHIKDMIELIKLSDTLIITSEMAE
jgi:hypothetical protein